MILAVILLCALCSCGHSADPAAGEEKYTTDISKDYVDEFLAAVGEMKGDRLLSGVEINKDNCYNVTPEQVAEETNIRIFKCSDSAASFAMVDGAVAELCASFGGYGFVNAVPCDFDNNGVTDLLVASSWGSGLHRSEISVFNAETLQSTVIYDSFHSDDPAVDLIVSERSPISLVMGNFPSIYTVYTAKIEVNNDNFADLSCVSTAVVGTVSSENGSAVFESPAFWLTAKESARQQAK
ncbi:MAG: hypothetical protein ACI4IV_07570 [Acutalibacteraceae bacterium]